MPGRVVRYPLLFWLCSLAALWGFGRFLSLEPFNFLFWVPIFLVSGWVLILCLKNELPFRSAFWAFLMSSYAIWSTYWILFMVSERHVRNVWEAILYGTLALMATPLIFAILSSIFLSLVYILTLSILRFANRH